MKTQRPLSVSAKLQSSHLLNDSPLNQHRPASDMLGIKSSEADALDKWFEDLNYYESTLENMAKAKLDGNFREELSAIEQWFVVLSDAERTAALYALMQHVNPVQIRFFSTVLNQKASKDVPISRSASPRSSMLGAIGSARAPPGFNGAASDGMLPSTPGSAMTPQSKPSFMLEAQEDLQKTYLEPGAFDLKRLSQTSIQVGLLRPRTPVEEAIAAADWSAQKSNSRVINNEKKNVNRSSWIGGSNEGTEEPSVRHPAAVLGVAAIQNYHSRSSSPMNNQMMQQRSSSPMMRSHTPSSMYGMLRSMTPDATGIAAPAPRRSMTPMVAHSSGWKATEMSSKFKNRPASVAPNESSVHSDDSDDGSIYNGKQRQKSPTSSSKSSANYKEKGKIPEQIDLQLVQDVPAWLRSLRLHKYTSIFEKMSYIDMIEFDDEQLEALGVAALGARRKMLKVFELVKAHLAGKV